MSVDARRSPADAGLAAVIARAGGVLAPGATREPAGPAAGRAVVHHGSAAGELAALTSSVGLADRSDLVKLDLRGPPGPLSRLVAGLAATSPAPGGAVQAGAAWWCALSPVRVIVVAERSGAQSLSDRLGSRAAHDPALRVHDRTADWSAIAVLGRRARELLSGLGVYGETGDPRRVTPVTVHPVAGAGALWLLEADDRALAVVQRAEAAVVWRAILAAGRPLRICAAGREAVTRYGLLQRRTALAAL